MNLIDIINELKLDDRKISDNEFALNLKTKYFNGNDISISVINREDKFYITDNKETLKYMNKIYELKSKDVKQCINDVVRHYKFIINKGELLAEIKDQKKALSLLCEFIMCIGQLSNMYVFFDQPN